MKHSRNTPLHLAVVATAMRMSKTLQHGSICIAELLEHRADVNAVNKDGMTALHEVCRMGVKELVDLLLDYGADINKLNRAGESCLFLLLNHGLNMRNSSLLVKLFSLTYPLKLHDHKGHLPSALMLPCFSKQREQLLKLTRQPRKLQHICKCVVYLKHNHKRREELRKILPQKVYDFVFNCWQDLHISSKGEGEQDFYNNSFDIAPI